MRIKRGTFQQLGALTGISSQYLSDLAATRKRPGRNRALLLEKAAEKMGYKVPAALWLYGKQEQIKAALSRKLLQGMKRR